MRSASNTRRFAVLAVLLPSSLWCWVGCTQDFEQFESRPSSAASSSRATGGPGGTGGEAAVGGGGDGGAGASNGAGAAGASGGAAGAGGVGQTGSGGAGVAGAGGVAGGGGSGQGGFAGGGGAAASSSAATGGGGQGSENCVDGIDDDGDGAIDCGDSDCAPAYGCVPQPPPGWSGPVAFYSGAPGTSPPCPSAFPQLVMSGAAGLVPEPANCSACTCTPPSVTCTPSNLEAYPTSDCSFGPTSVMPQGSNGCTEAPVAGNTKTYVAAPPQADASGACVSSGGTTTLPPPKWTSVARGCAPADLGGGCGGGMCAPKSSAPFGADLCVYAPGNIGCPQSYPVGYTFAQNYVDTRGCSACGCGPMNATCTAETTVFKNAGCTGASAVVPNDGSCVTGPTSKSFSTAVTGSVSCAPLGGQPTGNIVEGPTYVTVCCLP